MDIELYLKIASAITAIGVGCILLWRANKELFFGSRNSLRDEYKFANGFFDDIKKNPTMHRYAYEKGLQAIAGNPSLQPGVIEYLLKHHDPVSVLKDYVFAKKYLEHLPTSGQKQIQFKKNYAKKHKRTTLKVVYIAGYATSYLLAVSPVLAGQWGFISDSFAKPLLILTLPLFMVTIVSMVAFVRIKRAEQLVARQ